MPRFLPYFLPYPTHDADVVQIMIQQQVGKMNVKQALLGTIAAAVVVVGSVAGAAPALAATPAANTGTFTMQNLATGLCIDDSWGAGLRAFPCNGLNYQHWTQISPVSVGGNHWQNGNTGRCIDDSGAGLRSFPCNGGNYQWWRGVYNSTDNDSWQNYNTGRCLDDSQAYGFRPFACNGSSYQRWHLSVVG